MGADAVVGITSPYAQTLGLTRCDVGDRVILAMLFADTLLGRPGFLHGGEIAGLLENAAWVAVRAALGDDPAQLKPVGITVDFLRGGQQGTTYASARIVRLGRRIAVVQSSAWQDDEQRPIATADLKLLLVRDGGLPDGPNA